MIITYVGKERCDILYYLIKIGTNYGKKIEVYDNSITHDFFNILEKDDRKDYYETPGGGLKVYKDYQFESGNTNADYVFIYEGLYPRYLGYIDLAVIAPSFEATEWKMIHDHVTKCKLEKVKTAVVFRDKVNNKFTNNAAAIELGVNYTPYIQSIPFDKKEYSTYVSLTQNRRSNMQSTTELFEVVKGLAVEIYKIQNEKTLTKLMKK